MSPKKRKAKIKSTITLLIVFVVWNAREIQSNPGPFNKLKIISSRQFFQARHLACGFSSDKILMITATIKPGYSLHLMTKENSSNPTLTLSSGKEYVIRSTAYQTYHKWSTLSGGGLIWHERPDTRQCLKFEHDDRPKTVTWVITRPNNWSTACKTEWFIIPKQFLVATRTDDCSDRPHGRIHVRDLITFQGGHKYIKANSVMNIKSQYIFDANYVQTFLFDKETLLRNINTNTRKIENLIDREDRFMDLLLGRDSSIIDYSRSQRFYRLENEVYSSFMKGLMEYFNIDSTHQTYQGYSRGEFARRINYDGLPGYFLVGPLENSAGSLIHNGIPFHSRIEMKDYGMGQSTSISFYLTNLNRPVVPAGQEYFEKVEVIFDSTSEHEFAKFVIIMYIKWMESPNLIEFTLNNFHSSGSQLTFTIPRMSDQNKVLNWVYFYLEVSQSPYYFSSPTESSVVTTKTFCLGQLGGVKNCYIEAKKEDDIAVDKFYSNVAGAARLIKVTNALVMESDSTTIYRRKMSLFHVRVLEVKVSRGTFNEVEINQDYKKSDPVVHPSYKPEKCLKHSLFPSKCLQLMFAERRGIESRDYLINLEDEYEVPGCDFRYCDVCYKKNQCLIPKQNFYRNLIEYPQGLYHSSEMRGFVEKAKDPNSFASLQNEVGFVKSSIYKGDYDGDNLGRENGLMSCPLECKIRDPEKFKFYHFYNDLIFIGLNCNENFDCIECAGGSIMESQKSLGLPGGKTYSSCKVKASLPNCNFL